MNKTIKTALLIAIVAGMGYGLGYLSFRTTQEEVDTLVQSVQARMGNAIVTNKFEFYKRCIDNPKSTENISYVRRLDGNTANITYEGIALNCEAVKRGYYKSDNYFEKQVIK